MSNIALSRSSTSLRIDKIEVTDDQLTSRAGLSTFVRYLNSINVFPTFEKLFRGIRKNRKSQPLASIFKQIICFLADGTSSHISYFDDLRDDQGYAAGIEVSPEEMLSSHSVKRFFRKFSPFQYFMFRRLLQKLFIWRLNHEKPSVIILGVDTMVMDNNDAVKRQGAQPTYKKVKGFQPLQLNWKGYFVDAVFRGGKKHSNYSDTVQKMITHAVKQIRKHYSEDVPIILRCDAGFFDKKLFRCFRGLGIGILCGGKHYADINAFVGGVKLEHWEQYKKGEGDKARVWSFYEFGDRRGTWAENEFLRAFYCTQETEENGQYLMEFVKHDSIIYTNMGMGGKIDEQLISAGHGNMMEPGQIIETYFGRGSDELVNRAFKDFVSQKLPFKRFNMNASYYYLSLTAFLLLEAFKHDVCSGIIPISAYSTTIRRQLFDIAGKIIRKSRYTILKVTASIMKRLEFDTLWERCNNPPIKFTWL
jgi:hypothetical protein